MKISIAGNVGSGKSSVVQSLINRGFNAFEEPIARWSMLPKFYEDMPRWSFALQIQILYTLLDSPDDGLNIFERSPWESLNIFSKISVENGYMSKEEYTLLKDLHDKIAWSPNIIIYLRASPDVCMERITKRGRDCESGIDPHYIKMLHDTYEKEVPECACAVTIDAERPIDEVFESVLNIVNKYYQY